MVSLVHVPRTQPHLCVHALGAGWACSFDKPAGASHPVFRLPARVLEWLKPRMNAAFVASAFHPDTSKVCTCICCGVHAQRGRWWAGTVGGGHDVMAIACAAGHAQALIEAECRKTENNRMHMVRVRVCVRRVAWRGVRVPGSSVDGVPRAPCWDADTAVRWAQVRAFYRQMQWGCHDAFAALGKAPRMPTLLLTGEADQLTPPEQARKVCHARAWTAPRSVRALVMGILTALGVCMRAAHVLLATGASCCCGVGLAAGAGRRPSSDGGTSGCRQRGAGHVRGHHARGSSCKVAVATDVPLAGRGRAPSCGPVSLQFPPTNPFRQHIAPFSKPARDSTDTAKKTAVFADAFRCASSPITEHHCARSETRRPPSTVTHALPRHWLIIAPCAPVVAPTPA